jgi:hypothetical protein
MIGILHQASALSGNLLPTKKIGRELKALDTNLSEPARITTRYNNNEPNQLPKLGTIRTRDTQIGGGEDRCINSTGNQVSKETYTT